MEPDESFYLIAPPLKERTSPRVDPESKRAQAYLAWATSPVKGGGMLHRLAQDLGVKYNTLRWWKAHDRWEERWIDDIHGARVRFLREGEAVLLTALRPALERLGSIAATGNDRDAVQAVKVLAAIMGMDQSHQVVNLTQINPVLITEAMDVSKAEMRKALAALGQTNTEENRAKRR